MNQCSPTASPSSRPSLDSLLLVAPLVFSVKREPDGTWTLQMGQYIGAGFESYLVIEALIRDYIADDPRARRRSESEFRSANELS